MLFAFLLSCTWCTSPVVANVTQEHVHQAVAQLNGELYRAALLAHTHDSSLLIDTQMLSPRRPL